MSKAIFVFADYVAGGSVTHQGTYKSIQHYLKNGYKIKQERNGFWVLAKPAQVMITLKDEDGNSQTFDMKEDILEYYDKERISKNLVERFANDATTGKIQFSMYDNGYSFE